MNFKILAVVAASMAAAAANAAVTDFTVNGTKVTAAQQEEIIKAMTARGQARTPALEQAVKQNLIANIAVLQEARKQGIDKDPEVMARISAVSEDIQRQALVGKYLQAHPATDAELQQLYQADKTRWGDTEYHVRHLTTLTEADANKALDRIRKGESFEKVASEVSMDQGTKAHGGELGWVPAAIPQIGSLFKGMKKGQLVAKPVQIQGGFDVFQVVDTRPAQFPTFEQAKPRLARMVMERRAADYVKNIASQAVVK
ncbi:MAG: peptidyl-prolyl cis-trans isomerase [Mesosutterella sp.]|nr:peptidyl-prolyl cis-trans isomerase [Mesosutterella sp.]